MEVDNYEMRECLWDNYMVFVYGVHGDLRGSIRYISIVRRSITVWRFIQ